MTQVLALALPKSLCMSKNIQVFTFAQTASRLEAGLGMDRTDVQANLAQELTKKRAQDELALGLSWNQSILWEDSVWNREQ